MKTLNYEEAKALLAKHGQLQLLRFYDELDTAQRQNLLRQIAELDFSLVEKLHAPVQSAAGHYSPMAAATIEELTENEAVYEALGLQAIREGKLAAVLLAGGQGTRLGLSGPKGTLNVGITKTLYLFEMLVRNLEEVTRKAGVALPLCVMTSEINDAETRAFWKANHFFGYPETEIFFFVQDMAPCCDLDGKFLLEAKDRISRSPNGNGGWFVSMQKAGLVDILKARGVTWLNCFSVDNVLQRIADPVMLGATLAKGYESSAKVVAKTGPDEKVGVLCLDGGHPSIVEYYEMTDEMRSRVLDDGHLAYRFGVTLNYDFRIDRLEETTRYGMPLHVVDKKIPYLDENGTLISPDAPNGHKFETLILDMVRLMNNCLPTEVVREKEFAPIKNLTGVDSLESARALLEKNGIAL